MFIFPKLVRLLGEVANYKVLRTHLKCRGRTSGYPQFGLDFQSIERLLSAYAEDHGLCLWGSIDSGQCASSEILPHVTKSQSRPRSHHLKIFYMIFLLLLEVPKKPKQIFFP